MTRLSEPVCPDCGYDIRKRVCANCDDEMALREKQPSSQDVCVWPDEQTDETGCGGNFMDTAPVEWKFCPFCGKPLVDPRFCDPDSTEKNFPGPPERGALRVSANPDTDLAATPQK